MTFFEDKIDREAKGKNLNSIKKSRKIRKDFIEYHGIIPESILKANFAERKALDLITDVEGRKQSDTYYHKRHKEKKLLKWEKEAYCLSGVGTKAGGLSKFPQNIGKILLDFYCPEDGIWYDPFAGHNSRMQLSFESNKDYIGIDISKKFMEANHKIKTILLSKEKNKIFRSKSKITLIEGSSDKVDVKSNNADFTLTSPPYWDIEYYGDELKQLGKAKTYKEFLNLITQNIKENFRILKPNSFCIYCVNDFRRKGVFHSYHSDLIKIFKRLKFIHFNTYIVDLGNSFGQAFVQEIVRTKIFPKRHEYILVFKKP